MCTSAIRSEGAERRVRKTRVPKVRPQYVLALGRCVKLELKPFWIWWARMVQRVRRCGVHVQRLVSTKRQQEAAGVPTRSRCCGLRSEALAGHAVLKEREDWQGRRTPGTQLAAAELVVLDDTTKVVLWCYTFWQRLEAAVSHKRTPSLLRAISRGPRRRERTRKFEP